ncbi:MAG: hypothetical protein GY711_07655 [bacterium]|nr:hypothetical protein [bacterium]
MDSSSRCLILVLLSTSPAAGQELVFGVDGDSPRELFGTSVAAADVTGDGVTDIIAGAPNDDANGSRSGTVRVLSGVDGSVVYTHVGPEVDDFFGASVGGAGDVNMDGVEDYIVGAPRVGSPAVGNGNAYVYSGADGTLIWQLSTGNPGVDLFGRTVAGLGDVDGDGHSDVAVGAIVGGPTPNSFPGQVRVFSGASGQLLYFLQGVSDGVQFGAGLCATGDVNGDDRADFAVASPFELVPGVGFGRVRLYSGATADVLRTYEGSSSAHDFGRALASSGDFDGDGNSDLLIGSPSRFSDIGFAAVYSSATGALLLQVESGLMDDAFGVALDGAGDVDGDGVLDLLVGAPGDWTAGVRAGAAHVFSGTSGLALFKVEGEEQDDLGTAVSRLGDLDGDGDDEVVIASPHLNVNIPGPGGPGKVEVYRWDTLTFTFQTEDDFATPLVNGQAIGGGEEFGSFVHVFGITLYRTSVPVPRPPSAARRSRLRVEVGHSPACPLPIAPRRMRPPPLMCGQLTLHSYTASNGIEHVAVVASTASRSC